MTEHEHVWIGYCDLCNGQHCVTLKAADAKVERKLHGDPVCVAALRERDAAWAKAVHEGMERIGSSAIMYAPALYALLEEASK